MSHTKHVMPFRRKHEGKTNYKKRLSLLKSGKPRLIIRKSNTALTLQLITYEPDGDRIHITLNSKALKKQGWTGSVKSLPAAYCTGYLFAKQATQHGIKEAIVDLGLQQHRGGTRIYAAVKGVVDGGLPVPVSESIFPSAERLAGAHLAAGVADAFTKLGIPLPKASGSKASTPKAEKPPKEAQKAKPQKEKPAAANEA